VERELTRMVRGNLPSNHNPSLDLFDREVADSSVSGLADAIRDFLNEAQTNFRVGISHGVKPLKRASMHPGLPIPIIRTRKITAESFRIMGWNLVGRKEKIRIPAFQGKVEHLKDAGREDFERMIRFRGLENKID
jgi:hypothetical protein